MLDLSKEYNQYCEDVLSHNIITNKWIYLACDRYKKWFDRDDIWFDEEDVDLKIRFMEKMKHSKGEFADKQFILFPYQKWIVANIIGWKYKNTTDRVINTALLMLARKSGKTFFASALLLAVIMTDKEKGSEGYMIANSSQQASIAFTHAKEQCYSLDKKGKIFSRYRSQIRIPLLNSKIQILSADTNKLDGMQPKIFIVDEYHASKTTENYDVLRTGQGSCKNPLGIIISSAGFLTGDEFPLYAAWSNALEVLQGIKEQDNLFAAIYQLDEGDKFDDETCWIKANPTLGGSISYKFLREQVIQAKNNASQEVSIKTKNFNMWCNSATTWIPNEDILKYTINFSDMKFTNDYCCYCGVDLSTVSDLTAVSYVVGKDDACYFKTDYYLPRGGVEKSKNKELYKKWEKEGYLTITDGERINYDYVVSDIKKQNEKIPILEIYYDKYNAQAFKQQCEDEGMVMTAFSQTMGSFNAPTKDFERNLYLGKIFIDNNPITRWCFRNVELKMDANENVKPFKGAGANNKIDGVIAMIQAYAGYLKTFIYGQISTI